MENETNRHVDEEILQEDPQNEEENEAQTNDEDIQVDENVDEVSSRVTELEKKLEETSNRMLRVQADYDNFRRRTKEEKEAAAKYRSQNLAESLLPALDNFERAMMIEPNNEEAKSLLEGMEMVYRQLREALAKEGIEQIEAVGQPFDPHVHQAVMQVESDEHESNVVVEEMQKGYQLKDRVIRPSMVKVNA